MGQTIRVVLTDIPLTEEQKNALKNEDYYVLNGPSQTTFINDRGLSVPLLQVVGTRPKLQGGGVPLLWSFNVTKFLAGQGASEDEINKTKTPYRGGNNQEILGDGHALGTDVRTDLSSEEAGVDLTYAHLLEWHSQVKNKLDDSNRVILRENSGKSTGLGLFRPDLSKGIVEITFSLTKLKNDRGSFFAFEDAIILPNSGGLYGSLGSRPSKNMSANESINALSKTLNKKYSKEDLPAPAPTSAPASASAQQSSPFVTF